MSICWMTENIESVSGKIESLCFLREFLLYYKGWEDVRSLSQSILKLTCWKRLQKLLVERGHLKSWSTSHQYLCFSLVGHSNDGCCEFKHQHEDEVNALGGAGGSVALNFQGRNPLGFNFPWKYTMDSIPYQLIHLDNYREMSNITHSIFQFN